MAGILSTYKIPQPRGYVENSYYIEDTSPTSPRYFNIDYFPLVMGGGKHIIRLKGNGLNMRLKSKIDVEIIDAAGNNIFCEVQNYRDRFNNYYITLDGESSSAYYHLKEITQKLFLINHQEYLWHK